MKTERTLEQIRRDGLAALRDRPGVVGLVRFLQQFNKGNGNWAKERHKWVDQFTMDDVRKMIAKPRAEDAESRMVRPIRAWRQRRLKPPLRNELRFAEGIEEIFIWNWCEAKQGRATRDAVDQGYAL